MIWEYIIKTKSTLFAAYIKLLSPEKNVEIFTILAVLGYNLVFLYSCFYSLD